MLYNHSMKNENYADKTAQNNKYAKRYRTNKYLILKIVGAVAVAAIALFLVSRFLIGVSAVSGDSMYPTYKSGQLVFYSRTDKSYEVGDVIAMNYLNGDFYIKRIVAVAGDTVDIRDGQVYVNDQLQSYGNGETAVVEGSGVTYPFTVSEGSVFVMGDNRGTKEDGSVCSVDSRTFGEVSTSQLQGVILGGK